MGSCTYLSIHDEIYINVRIVMEKFRHALNGLAVLGIGKHQLTPQKYLLNRKNVQTLLILYVASSLCCAYLLHEVNTFQEYAKSIYISSTFITGAVVYSILIWKNDKMFEQLDFMEQIIDESETHYITCMSNVDDVNAILFIFQD